MKPNKLKKINALYLNCGPNEVVRLSRDTEGTFSVELHTGESITINVEDKQNEDSVVSKSKNGFYCELFDEYGFNWDVYTNPLDAF